MFGGIKFNVMKNIIHTFLLFTSFLCFGQNPVKISFDSLEISLTRMDKDQLYSIPLNVDLNALDSYEEYKLLVKANLNKSTLASQEYSIYFEKKEFKKLKSKEEIFIKINKDVLPDRARKIVLDLKFYKNGTEAKLNNEGDFRSITLNVLPANTKLIGYEYLGYVGTNFDLVEGIKAKDLFFAANILNVPERTKSKKVGFYLSLYGNRAFSQVDSSRVLRRRVSIDSISDSSYQLVNETGRVLETSTTDNLGAYISPLFKWPFKQMEGSNLNLYYSPSLEFVYRRTRLTTSPFNRISIDTTIVEGSVQDILDRPMNPDLSRSQIINEYSFNAGIVSLFLVHETNRISVRVHGSVGYSSNFFGDLGNGRSSRKVVQQSDIFFSGRAWITESNSGITLQAEVTNSLFNPRPFFVATLSKAFDFKDLGKIFQPITSR
jgi:hypothetical protein